MYNILQITLIPIHSRRITLEFNKRPSKLYLDEYQKRKSHKIKIIVTIQFGNSHERSNYTPRLCNSAQVSLKLK